MTKSDVLKMYNGWITAAEQEVYRLREELDDTLDYLGEMNRKKYELENGTNNGYLEQKYGKEPKMSAKESWNWH